MDIYRIKERFIFTIFGASGDLAKLKIFPALFALAKQGRLLSDYAIVGYARSEKTLEQFKFEFAEAVKRSLKAEDWSAYDEEVLQKLCVHLYYFAGQYDVQEDFVNYRNFLDSLQLRPAFEICFFSVPPTVVMPVAENLAAIRPADGTELRLVLEKPFGENEESAVGLHHFLHRFFRDSELFILDHYLGKKALRSILALRSRNRILNLLLQGAEIANIQISALETAGVGKRIGYFDQVGIVKDMVQSHLLQILAYATMCIPLMQSTDSIQNEKNAIIAALNFERDTKNLIFAQYEGYRHDCPATDSTTPTYAALRLNINRENWENVPLFIRTGKSLGQQALYMVVEFKKSGFQTKRQESNRIIIEFFPEERIHFQLVDEDGFAQLGRLDMSQSLACQGDYCLPAHALLLLDVFRGDRMYFLSVPEILNSWRLIDDILNFANEVKTELFSYPQGSCGPLFTGRLMHDTDFQWYEFNGPC
jgi:glucose-6-phosphate 1-dehydrogenase